ncbi:MAG: SRPBCC domain-containing protein [Dyadobacter sp.]|uniref:SRPBCC family protein n=1 Tax=Dyadobacter sp. TaxID=1914288 RepID=UPI001AFF99E4|nr:SRPBCC domain-containing protein [Dyadobacter sp.]MBO9617124.1 SRPBCC domain-containing protein [Dyadobacter sp.]
MSAQDFSATILVDQTPEEVFEAVTHVRGWWSEEIEGNTAALNDEFKYSYEDVHRCHIRLVEVVPAQRVVWLILDNYFKFTEDEKEWTGTRVVFDITRAGNQAQLQMTHQGLVPEFECFNICRDAWSFYVKDSLYNLITTGTGKPNAKGKPQTENEKAIAAAEK